MLIEFTVENFRSIKEAQTLSMLASKHRELPENVFESGGIKSFPLLKTAAIYGPNASGKSNIIKALNILQQFVFNSTNIKLGEKIIYYDPHRLDMDWTDRPTRFEIEFVADDNIRYRYSVAFTAKEIEHEELVFFPKGQEALLFSRGKNDVKFGNSMKGRKQGIAAELLSNNLFLSKAANSNHPLLKNIYTYFSNKLIDYENIGRDSETLNSVSNALLNKSNKLLGCSLRLENLLVSTDTGITSIRLEKKIDLSSRVYSAKMQNQIESYFGYDIITQHNVFKENEKLKTMDFRLQDESDGTIRLYGLGGWVVFALEFGNILVVDELENSLHPLISEFLVRLFNDPEKNPKNAQLVFTTHDTTLLNPDLLRRDQIWFTEKDEYGATQLYSLAEFDTSEVRKNTPFASWYLTGRFGALPLIDRKGFNLFDKEKQDGEDAQTQKDE